MQPNNTSRLSAEMLATADALRHVRAQLSHLVNANHPAIVGQSETTVVLMQGPAVALALEALATRLGITE
jgi:hypothetical protein